MCRIEMKDQLQLDSAEITFERCEQNDKYMHLYWHVNYKQ